MNSTRYVKKRMTRGHVISLFIIFVFPVVWENDHNLLLASDVV